MFSILQIPIGDVSEEKVHKQIPHYLPPVADFTGSQNGAFLLPSASHRRIEGR